MGRDAATAGALCCGAPHTGRHARLAHVRTGAGAMRGAPSLDGTSSRRPQSGGGKLTYPSANVCAHTADQFWNYHKSKPFGERAWPALLRLLDRHNPGYDA